MSRRTGIAMQIGVVFLLVVAPAGSFGSVAINEVAWAGNAFDYTAEWIELVNTGDDPIDLDGWRLSASDGAPNVTLTGILLPTGRGPENPGYYLMERNSEGAVPSRAADLIYAGALSDHGETLTLYDPEGHPVDTANAGGDAQSGWSAGSAWTGDTAPRSMERVDPLLPDVPSNWATARCDPEAASIELFCGTPRAVNSTFDAMPIARMVITPRFPRPEEPVRFDASGSSGAFGEIVSFAWTFGDGSVAEGQTASHVYGSSGDYTVVLLVTNATGVSSRLLETLSVRIPNPPRADFSVIGVGSRILRAGTPIEFLDESGEGSAAIAERTWSLGDGATADAEHVTHEFATSGTYTVCLTILDEQGSRSERCDSIVLASRVPSAAFTVESGIHSDGETVTFDASPSADPDGQIAIYHWDFDGDGETDQATESPQMEHAFETGGYFAPCLVVEDEEGDRSAPVCHSLYVNSGPAPAFSISDFEPREIEDVRFSDQSHDPDGAILQWHWDFGDGGTATQTSPVHAFRVSGAYTITLTVTDDQSASRTAVATIDVVNLPPVAAIESASVDEETGFTFSFDASDSMDPSPEGRIATYEWDIDGDGAFDRETTSSSLYRQYLDDGTYGVSVRVTDNQGAVSDATTIAITIRNRPPVVEGIACSGESPTDGVEITFTTQSSDPDGNIVAWEWTFGEEATSADAEPIHIFRQNRTYTITVIVRDDDGAASAPFQIDIPVSNALPIASFNLARAGPGIVFFDASPAKDPSPEGEIVHFAWDFGDGTACPDDPSACGTGSQTSPVHQFPAPGTYDVTLIVIDDDGGIGRSTRSVTID